MDKYAINNLVGEGSFGKVYKAIDKESKTTVALKIISKVSSARIEVDELIFIVIFLEGKIGTRA